MTPKLTAMIVTSNKELHGTEISTKKIVAIGNPKVETVYLDSTDNVFTEINRHKDIDLLVTIGNDINTSVLTNASFEIRKKWVHFNEFDQDAIAEALVSTFMLNIGRDKGNDKLFSFFTCTFNTAKNVLMRLYDSLTAQTYANWNWWILDDSSTSRSVTEYLEKMHDPRIYVIKNITNHGNIGFNKHTIAMAADGDYLVEIDHDDEITPDCLQLIKNAFETYPDVDFVYSHAIEEMDGRPITYDETYALGQGAFSSVTMNGVTYDTVPMTPNLNCLTVRHIVGLPNHVRCWKRDFYHRIGGHNKDLAVLDDMDLLLRTFLNTRLCKIDKVLYIQHEGSSNDNKGRGSTTQGNRFDEILRVGVLLRWKYDKEIHERILDLGFEDEIWNEEKGYSEISVIQKPFPNINYIYKP